MEQNRINQRNSTTVVYFLVRLAGSSPAAWGIFYSHFSERRVTHRPLLQKTYRHSILNDIQPCHAKLQGHIRQQRSAMP